MNKSAIDQIIALSAGLAIGGGLGYILTKRRLVNVYAKAAEAEIEQVREFYHRKHKDGVFETVESTAEFLIGKDGDEEEGGKPDDFRLKAPVPITENGVDAEVLDYVDRLEAEGYSPRNLSLFRADDKKTLSDTIDGAIAEPNTEELRTPNRPYVITVAEFMEDSEHEKESLTWFEDDNVLIEESNEQVIPNIEEIVSNIALTKFGEGSDDKDIVYVRNERLHTDYEITLHHGSYTEIVLGLREDKPGVQRFREGD